MSRIPAHSHDSAPEEARPTLQRLAKRSGKLLAIHAEMAHAPVVLAAYTGLADAVAQQGSFDAKTREAIALAVGAVNDCHYCQSVHTLAARRAGFSEAETLQIRSGSVSFDPVLSALVTLVREAAGSVGNVSDATWNAALDEGWTDVQLAEAFAHLAQNLFTNFFNHYARTELDVAAAPALVR